MLGLSQDQFFSCFFHHLFGHCLQVVDFQNTLDLHQETVNDTKIASSNTHNSSQSFLIRKIIHTNMHTQVAPTLFSRSCSSPAIFRRWASSTITNSARLGNRYASKKSSFPRLACSAASTK